MKLLRELFWVSRPISWVNTAYPFAVGYWLLNQRIDATLIFGTLYFLIPYNLLMYGINDVFDYESDLRNPRKGSIEGSVLDPRWHRPILWAAALSNLPFLVWLSLNRSGFEIALLAFVTFMVVAYSARGMRFKEIPILDSFTSACHFVGPLAVGLAFAGGALTTGVSGLAILAFMLWGMASHAFGAVQDIQADREGGISSVATVLGARVTVWFALLAYVAAGVAVELAPWPAPLAAIVVVPYVLMVLPYLAITDAECEKANAGWKRFIAINYLAGFLVTMLLIVTKLGLLG